MSVHRPLIHRTSLTAVALFLFQGCATITRGGSEPVVISSEPSGANVVIDSVQRGSTPLVVTLKRNESHTIHVDAPGYVTQTLSTKSKTDYLPLAGNLLLFHPATAAIGLGVDLVTGSHRRVTPNVLSFNLARVDVAPLHEHTIHQWQPAPIGSRLRISYMGIRTLGTLRAIAGDTLVVDSGVNERELIPRGAIERLELGVGADRPRSVTRWAWKGALIGLGTGAAVGLALHGGLGAYYYSTLLGAPAGFVAGIVAGAVSSPQEKWMVIR